MKRVVARESHIVGTYNDETLLALLNGGTLKLTDQYWDDATSTWRTLTDFIGAGAPARWLGPALKRVAVLLFAAGCGSLVTWFLLRNSTPPEAGLVAGVPALAGSDALGERFILSSADAEPAEAGIGIAASQPTKTLAPAEAKPPSSSLAILNVEVFDEEVAVTVQNNGPDAAHGFDLRLKYFELPAEKLVFDHNETVIGAHAAKKAEREEKSKALEAIIEALNRNLKIVDTDVITWTPEHVKALPTAEQWKAFGEAKLGAAGAALTSTATAFAVGASGADPAARKKALTELLLDLARRTEDIRPLLEDAMDKAAAARDRLAAEQNEAEARLSMLKEQQRELEPRLEQLMSEAQKKTLRTEMVHVDAIVETERVQRITVKRQKNEREGVAVELPSPNEKAVAVSGAS